MSENEPPEVFVSYAHEDRELLVDKLEPHLALLQRQGAIKLWHDGRILAGSRWAPEIAERLETAKIILLLVSADFIASDYCWSNEMTRALERDADGSARVVPVIIRPCMWETAPFGQLQALPTDGKPVSTAADVDAAFTEVAKGIARVVADLSNASGS